MGTNLLGIRVNLSPKRECGSKRVNAKKVSTPSPVDGVSGLTAIYSIVRKAR